jgi:hypothetical protein
MEFVLCIHNNKYPVSLEKRKVYRVIADSQASQKNFVRIIDESGEDYLYPVSYFVPVQIPQVALSAFATV